MATQPTDVFLPPRRLHIAVRFTMKSYVVALALLSASLASATPLPSSSITCVLQSTAGKAPSSQWTSLGFHPVLPLQSLASQNMTNVEVLSLFIADGPCAAQQISPPHQCVGEVELQAGDELVLIAQQSLERSVPVFEAEALGGRSMSAEVSLWSQEIRAAFTASSDVHKRDQRVLSSGSSDILIARPDAHLIGMSTSHAYALVQVSAVQLSRGLEHFFPSHTRLLRLRSPAGKSSIIAHTQEDEKPNPSYARPKFNPLVDDLLQSVLISTDRIREDVRILTGEDQTGLPKGQQGWDTRHSASWGARRAANWIRNRLDDSLASLPHTECHFDEYDILYSPLIVCTIPETKELRAKDEGGENDEEEGIVVISAHYDSRGTFGETTAPGADDDGSGTALLLALARVLGRSGVRFGREVRIVGFSGEEQGLLGSQYYAKKLRDEGTKIRMALQIDMIAFRKENEPMQVAFPSHLATASLTTHIQRVAQVYVPELVVGFTEVCCSDHQSFWEVGFPATWTFERTGPIADPKYHNSGDLSTRPGYDFNQLQATTKVVIATLFNVAGFWI